MPFEMRGFRRFRGWTGGSECVLCHKPIGYLETCLRKKTYELIPDYAHEKCFVDLVGLNFSRVFSIIEEYYPSVPISCFMDPSGEPETITVTKPCGCVYRVKDPWFTPCAGHVRNVKDLPNPKRDPMSYNADLVDGCRRVMPSVCDERNGRQKEKSTARPCGT